MSTEKHTPGPWSYTPIENSENGGYWITYMSPTGHKLAKLDTFDCPHEANAALIASAPSLKQENEDLQQEVKDKTDAAKVAYNMAVLRGKERDELKAENEKLKATNAEQEKLLDAWAKMLREGEGETQRLREALEKILKFSRVDYVTEIATEALKTPQ